MASRSDAARKKMMAAMSEVNSSDSAKQDKKPTTTSRRGPSINVKNREYEVRRLQNVVTELNEKIALMERASLDPQAIADLKQEIASLRSKVPQTVNPSRIRVTEHANRDEDFFETEEFYELVDSIRSEGQAIPIIVRPSHLEDFDYDLVSGRRRLEACRKLGIDIVAIVTEANDKKLLTLQVLENFRSDLNHFEECRNYQHMLDNEFFKNSSELAKTFGVSKGKISQIMSLTVIPMWLQKEYLTVKTQVMGHNYFKIEVAPLASLRGDFVKTIGNNADQIHNLKEYLDSNKSEYAALKDWKSKLKFILGFFEESTSKKTQSKTYDYETSLKIGSTHYGSIKGSPKTGIDLKILKRNYSKKLTEDIITAITDVLEKHNAG